jgi:hypothetical protein
MKIQESVRIPNKIVTYCPSKQQIKLLQVVHFTSNCHIPSKGPGPDPGPPLPERPGLDPTRWSPRNAAGYPPRTPPLAGLLFNCGFASMTFIFICQGQIQS